ncbi:MAG: isoprenylcysteine carboxylmethyltransferase family protein [Proteobacteria bacterium]|nr:isoprenylcysteine carboxylmethyltransferase family protein [Pseudomonadota bacterium]
MATRIPPPIVAIVTAFLMWMISILVPVGLFDLPIGMQVWLSAIIALVGMAIMFIGVFSFRKSGTTINPRKPEQASNLVLTGIYRKTRNPMYLGMLLLLSAWTIFLSSAIAFMGLPVFVLFMNRFQILPEERALEKLFGREFGDYLLRVRRWL